MNPKTIFRLCCIAFLAVLLSCGDNKSESSSTDDKKNETSQTATEKKDAEKSEATSSTKVEDGAALATIEAPTYIAKVHQAIAFQPKDDGAGMFKVKPGHQYVVLDMSVKNTSDKPLDIGQIMLQTAVTDDAGNKLPLYAMAIAAYTYTNPNEGHQTEYNALWGTMQPGEFHRTTVYGLQVPSSVKSLIVTMPEEGSLGNAKKNEMKFSL